MLNNLASLKDGKEKVKKNLMLADDCIIIIIIPLYLNSGNINYRRFSSSYKWPSLMS